MGICRLQIPASRIIDFVDDLRLVDSAGAHDELAGDMVAFKCLLGRFGARYRTREGKHWCSTKVIPSPGFVADTNSSVVRIGDKNLSKGMTLRQEFLGLQPDSTVAARSPLSSGSFNFNQWIAPGGFCHLRTGWNVVNDSGIMGAWRSGAGRAETQVVVTKELRNDVLRRRRALGESTGSTGASSSRERTFSGSRRFRMASSIAWFAG